MSDGVGRAAEAASAVDPHAGSLVLRSLVREAGLPEPEVGVVLGSGLGALVDAMDPRVEVPLAALPGLPAPTVAGHGGRFVVGRLGGAPVVLQAGRYHAYEGHPLEVVAAPIRIMAAFGVRALLVTNAVGGIRCDLGPGSLVLLDDLLNVTFRSPLVGRVRAGEARFPDMSEPFDRALQDVVLEAAAARGIPLARGVYGGVLGPAYETAAEIRMLSRFGADVVGMSTVPEVIAAVSAGLRCVGLSLVTNRATGLGDGRIAHEDVLDAGRAASGRLAELVTEVVARVARSG